MNFLRIKRGLKAKKTNSNIINSDDFIFELKELEKEINKLDLSDLHRMEVLYKISMFETRLLNKMELLED
jgi:hypothetical protein